MSRLKQQLKKLRTIQDRQQAQEKQDARDDVYPSLLARRLEEVERRRSEREEDGDEADD